MILEHIERYLTYCLNAEKEGYIIAEKISKAIRKFIPDIDYSIGWREGGIDTICFYSKKFNITNIKKDRQVMLEDVIGSVFPDLKHNIYCPYGIYITKNLARKIKKYLKRNA
ncbi:MAG: hypothetical protein ACTSRH_13845 [Promethearchaeota archaeon]